MATTVPSVSAVITVEVDFLAQRGIRASDLEEAIKRVQDHPKARHTPLIYLTGIEPDGESSWRLTFACAGKL